MTECNCNSDCKCLEHPEGVQVAIEILENIPEDMLDEFYMKVTMFPEKDYMEHWKETVNEWYSMQTNVNE